MMKVKITILCLLFLLCGTASFAQTGIDSTNYIKSLQFMQGDGVYESGMMTILAGLKEAILPCVHTHKHYVFQEAGN